MRPLGDSYVMTAMLNQVCNLPRGSRNTWGLFMIYRVEFIPEFRRHRDITNSAHIIGFLSQWKMYLNQIPPGEHARNFSGKRLDPSSSIFEKVFLIPLSFFFGKLFSC
jgi:hypothetical protein